MGGLVLVAAVGLVWVAGPQLFVAVTVLHVSCVVLYHILSLAGMPPDPPSFCVFPLTHLSPPPPPPPLQIAILDRTLPLYM